MRIHADNLTADDLYASLPDGVSLHCETKGSRKRARAFEVTLYVWEKDELHRRFGNSGGYGASDEVAATWDEWGIWIDRLYAIDPAALIGWYRDPSHFHEATMQHALYVERSNKPGSIAARTHRAPWLAKAAV